MIPNLNHILVIGARVVPRADERLALEDMRTLAEFTGYPMAVMAVRMLRRDAHWMTTAELLYSDHDYLEIQVLASNLKKFRPIVAADRKLVATTLEDLL